MGDRKKFPKQVSTAEKRALVLMDKKIKQISLPDCTCTPGQHGTSQASQSCPREWAEQNLWEEAQEQAELECEFVTHFVSGESFRILINLIMKYPFLNPFSESFDKWDESESKEVLADLIQFIDHNTERKTDA